ncbi:RraA family protein [Halomonas sp. AOP5-B2-8]
MIEGFRIRTQWQRAAKVDVERARGIAVSNISDVMSRQSGSPASIRPFHSGGPLSGPALTVRCRPGDNLMLHKALQMVQPGDVIVVDAEGALDNAIMGELMLARAVQAKAAGVVIYGAIRDTSEIAAQNVPVFAAGVSHRGPYKDGPGEIGYAISLGSMVIEPGDLIVGDADGVLAIPRATASDVLDRAEKKHAAEMKQLQQTLKDEYDSTWIDASLAAGGCYISDH